MISRLKVRMEMILIFFFY